MEACQELLAVYVPAAPLSASSVKKTESTLQDYSTYSSYVQKTESFSQDHSNFTNRFADLALPTDRVLDSADECALSVYIDKLCLPAM
eukprot:643774-Pyramimonas_sp.AAC.1